ncbi:MAG TPA: hypothetical protein PKD17_09610 [Cellvibrionaceae bacterium]|nr:hypothetical protein [Cellvibrionaceae bacterium]
MLPIQIMNAIAETGLMRSKRLSAVFSLKKQERADEALDSLTDSLEIKDSTLAIAFQVYAPLLMESGAVEEVRRNNPQWAHVLPELLTTGEALTMAQRDYMLSELQTEQLKALLSKPLQ